MKPSTLTTLNAVTPTVRVKGYAYHVALPTGSLTLTDTARVRWHVVRKDKTCDCGDPTCLAISVVTRYVKDGGEHAPQAPNGYAERKPATCPVCGAATLYAPKLSSSVRGVGWECEVGGKACYWEHQGHMMAQRVMQDKLVGTFKPLDPAFEKLPMGYLPAANKCYVRSAREPDMNFVVPAREVVEAWARGEHG